MSDDPDLRSRLERIASSAGDPPEHGLERVAARRHRRLRRRRGAVATAAVLAVFAVGAPLISQGLDDDRESVTASDDAAPAGAPPELPAEVEVRCEATGIVVPVASVRPQRDGLHIRVVNSLLRATTIRITSDDWSGKLEVQPGEHAVRQPVPPGEVRIGCMIGGRLDQRRIDLVDDQGYYREPALECDAGDPTVTAERALPVERQSSNLIVAARRALDDHLVGGSDDDEIGALRGYPSQQVRTDASDDPAVQAERDRDVIAFVFGLAPDPVTGRWTAVRIDACASVVDAGATTDSTTSSSVPEGAPAPEGGAAGQQAG